MTQDKKSVYRKQKDIVEKDVLKDVRRHRLIQICAAITLGLLTSLAVARGDTLFILAGGLSCLLIALGFAFKHREIASAYTLLSSMTAMLFALALTGAGLFDLSILGYPALIIFSAILGGVGLFLLVLALVIAQCFFLALLTLQNIIVPHVPTLTWPHFVFILIIFVVTGFSVYILVQDIKRLMFSLHNENKKVEHSSAKIQYLAHHDALTDLPNRLYGEALFEQCLKACDEKQQKLAILFIDLDNFKPVNDALGHAAGDQLLVQLSKRLSNILTSEQCLIRFGGDEFLVLVPFVKDKEQLSVIAKSLIKGCASIFEVMQTQVVISASIGITCAPQDGNQFKQLCRKADIAMYKAKRDGRNTFHYYDKDLDKASDEKFQLLQRLRPAIEEKCFELYYQPIVDLASGKIIAVEALMRWPQADGTYINPDVFIPIAESSGLINELGTWALQEACLHCARQRQKGFSNLRIAVNLSVIQFKDGRLQSIVESALYQAGLPAQALELELTESLLIDETDQIQQQLNALSQLGITIAIDDFGTGYSNLGYLRNFNASRLKIDRSFISSLCVSQDDESLVTAIINMAGSLGLETVAEGIEDSATLDKLKALGCGIGQGYYWSQAIPEEALSELLLQYEPIVSVDSI